MLFNKKLNSNTKILLSNFSYLSILEVIGILFPLLTYPYLIRTLGSDLYGVIIYAQAILAYVIITTNYGFNISATRKISENRENIPMVKTIFSSVIYLKLLISIIGIAVYFAVIYMFNFEYKSVYFLSVGMCFQEVFFPTWFFQGFEKMRYITIISFLSKLLFVMLIFVFVSSEQDFWYVPLFYSLGAILTSVLSLIIIHSKFKITLVKVKIAELKSDFKESTPFFASRIATVVMERSNVILLGLFIGYSSVAFYDLSVKVISIVKIPISITAQVLYPSLSKTKDLLIIGKIYKIMLFATVIISIAISFFSPLAVNILGGDKLIEAIPVLRIMVWCMPAIGVSTILGASTLVVSGFSKEYNRSVLYSFVAYIILTLFVIFSKQVNLYTMTVTFILPEFVVAVYRRYIVKKHKLINIL